MKEKQPTSGRLRLAWVSPITPWKLDTVTWLDTTRELRQLGMDVTLLAAGPPGPSAYRGIEVFNIERPETYLIGRVLCHDVRDSARKIVGRKGDTIDSPLAAALSQLAWSEIHLLEVERRVLGPLVAVIRVHWLAPVWIVICPRPTSASTTISSGAFAAP